MFGKSSWIKWWAHVISHTFLPSFDRCQFLIARFPIWSHTKWWAHVIPSFSLGILARVDSSIAHSPLFVTSLSISNKLSFFLSSVDKKKKLSFFYQINSHIILFRLTLYSGPSHFFIKKYLYSLHYFGTNFLN